MIAIQALILTETTYKTLPGAIRYVDPTWDEVAEGEPLRPAPYYWLGLATRDENKQEELNQEEQVD